jgi:hypothetical protein
MRMINRRYPGAKTPPQEAGSSRTQLDPISAPWLRSG